ncbi:hypothetical protein [Burkholderia multivorans]|uniref:hypothetical protein n=1 Tax=Burkholderia multivorans TaxID=87883 RepID=UPI001C220E95|nr:hypothetical protein [Burkholderia multivorans]MBU9624812.1 hypothetical protein [Burkholderia multivorans]
MMKSTATEEALKALILRTSAITAPPVDKAGREEVHRAAMDHKNARLAIEKAAKAATEDAKAFTRAVSAEEKRLIAMNAEEEARLFKLRDDYDAAEAARKAADERKERERVRMIRVNLDQIKNLPVDSAGDNAETLAATLDDLRAFEITFEDFAEFQDEARAARDASIASLTTMHAAAVVREQAEAAAREAQAKLAAQREELERQQREFEEQKAALARELAKARGEWCDTMDRPKAECGCPDCGPSLIDLGPELRNVPPEQPAVVAGPSEPEPEVVGTLTPAYDPLDPGNWRDGNAAQPWTSEHVDAIDQMSPPEERRVIVEPEFAGFDMAAGPDTQEPAKEMVTIPREEYESLLTRVRWLECLEAAGVDNWQGIEQALRLNRERLPA